ncbi:MAG: methyltransferase domain-containing protein, partial [Gammaproteobacteria bacterium]
NNVTFQHASVLDLPFEDNTFDVVFSQALLSHLQDPVTAVLEQKRVTKIGGMVVARTMYSSGIAYYPKNLLLEEASRFNFKPIKDNGGDPDLGIKLGKIFRKAGFGDIKHTMFCDTSFKSLAKDVFAPEVMNREYNKKLLAAGKITLKKLQQYQQAWLDFANDPDAFSYCPAGEIIAVKQKL